MAAKAHEHSVLQGMCFETY